MVAKITELLGKVPNDLFSVIRYLKEKSESLERAQKAKALSASYLASKA